MTFRELKQKGRSASTIVLMLACLHLGMGLVLYFVRRQSDLVPTDASTAEDVAVLIANVAIGFTMLACFAWSKRAPLAALTAALGGWLGVHALAAATSPLTLLGGLFVKILVFVLLARGMLAAAQAAALKRKIVRLSREVRAV